MWLNYERGWNSEVEDITSAGSFLKEKIKYSNQENQGQQLSTFQTVGIMTDRQSSRHVMPF